MFDPRILVMAGSNRSGAYSAMTADVAQKMLAIYGAAVTRISLADYPLPMLDEDLEKEKGLPENARRLARQIETQDGLLIVSPEYNASIPPLLKNAIDWVSRVRSIGAREMRAFDGKLTAICSSSTGAHGGSRGLYHLRAVLMHCGAEVITPQCSVSHGADAFDDFGELREERLKAAMKKVAVTLVERARSGTRDAD